MKVLVMTAMATNQGFTSIGERECDWSIVGVAVPILNELYEMRGVLDTTRSTRLRR
jgi:hypothetical protein